MRAMLIAFLAIVVIGVAAFFGLNQIGFSSAERQSAPSVRLD